MVSEKSMAQGQFSHLQQHITISNISEMDKVRTLYPLSSDWARVLCPFVTLDFDTMPMPTLFLSIYPTL